MLRAAAQGRGLFGLGAATRAEADAVGRAWVGADYTTSQDGRILLSADRLRQYRPPEYKRKRGIVQANLQWRSKPSGSWPNNGYIDIVNITEAP
jgi:hypothetical protein